ncbi:MAG: hypothetical protein AVDCRST_MAG64-1703, partial [uncultured Phycisphaerae bacterium]
VEPDRRGDAVDDQGVGAGRAGPRDGDAGQAGRRVRVVEAEGVGAGQPLDGERALVAEVDRLDVVHADLAPRGVGRVGRVVPDL